MAKDKEKSDAGAPDETITAPAQQGQVQLTIDESNVATYYSSITRISGTAEEIVVDFSQGIRPMGQNRATLKVDARVTLSPWAAKRLALALGQTVQRFEQTYGTLEIDPRKRQVGATTTS